MKNPKISLIIPVYNGGETLSKCLNSILNQSTPPEEIILIDNNSTDNTKRIIQFFQKKSEKIRYVFEKQRGRGIARNTGIKASKGDIILMTDSDCVAPKNWVQEIIKPIIEEGESVVMGSEYDLINNFWTRNYQKQVFKMYNDLVNGRYIENYLDTKNVAFKSKFIKKNLFDSSLKNCEDLEWSIRTNKTLKIRFLPEVKIKHYHKSSFSKFTKLFFDRGFWTAKIFLKYKNKEGRLNTKPGFKNLKLKNYLLLALWIIHEYLKIGEIGRVFYMSTAEISWRLGFLYGLLKK